MTAVRLPRDGVRVRLRRLAPADLPDFQAYRADADVGRWQGWSPMSDAAAAEFVAEMAAAPPFVPGAWWQLAIAEPASDALIGDIGLHLSDDGEAVEIGFTLARAAQHRGLAGEAVALAVALAFEHSAVARIVAISDTRNAASLRLLQRCGFRPVATLAADWRGAPCVEQHSVLHRSGRALPALRAARPADADAVARALITSRRVLLPFLPCPRSDADVHAWIAAAVLPAGGVTVAEVAGRVVGFVGVSRDATRGSWIDHLAVLPSHVGAGIGAALLAHALAALPRPLQLYTFQANLHARAFYERHGFVATQFSDGAATEERCPDVLYALYG